MIDRLFINSPILIEAQPQQFHFNFTFYLIEFDKELFHLLYLYNSEGNMLLCLKNSFSPLASPSRDSASWQTGREGFIFPLKLSLRILTSTLLSVVFCRVAQSLFFLFWIFRSKSIACGGVLNFHWSFILRFQTQYIFLWKVRKPIFGSSRSAEMVSLPSC